MRFPAALARFGIVDREKGEEAFDLAVPMMVTGGLRTFLRTADFFMVSLALGDAAVAGLELGFQYYFVPFGLALAVSSGTISVVSRFKGAEEHAKADLAVKQSLWIALGISIPVTAATWMYAEPLIGILTGDPKAIDLGATYLRIVMLSVAFRFWSIIASRALAGSGDTRTPMYVRLITLPTNVTLNALLIFGFGPFPKLGIAGAAWGTAISNTFAALVFFGLLLSGRFAIGFRFGGRQFDPGIVTEIVRVGLPLAGTRLSRTFGRFPFLFFLGILGTPVLAAYAIGRRIMLLALMPAWGYSTAASTLVGQSIGAGDDDEANDYGWQTLRIALATQIPMAALIIVFARPIAIAFGTEYVGLTVEFVRIFGLGVAGFGISRTMRGGLRGAGDMRWPFYGGIVGTYLVRLPLGVIAVPAGTAAIVVGSISIPLGVTTVSLGGFTIDPGLGFGIVAVYAAILADMYVRAGFNVFRFWSGKWKQVAAKSGVGRAGEASETD